MAASNDHPKPLAAGPAPQEVIIRIVVQQANQPIVSVRPVPPAGVAALSPTGLMSLPSRSRQYKRGQLIFGVKDKADTLMIVDTGVVRTFLEASGQETASRLVREGEIIGETALISDVRDYGAVAMEDASAREYDIAVVKAALANDPVGSEVARLLITRIHDLYTTMAAQTVLTTLNRLASLLINLAEQDGEPADGGVLIRSHITHEVLASLISARRETVTLHLQKLRVAGAVDSSSSGLFVRPDLLRKFAS
jgi:CRP/FNR family transcriptional regulator, cyclic AMP receptor protein